MKKKSILFIIPGYHHGGTNKSLQNMLSLLDDNLYKYYIFTTNTDNYYKKIFKRYNIIECSKTLYNYCNSKKILYRIMRLINRMLFNIIFELLSNKEALKIENRYPIDKVIAFEEGKMKTIAKYFKCKKIAWIHCDYKLYYQRALPNLAKEFHDYSLFDDIICVSKTTALSFQTFFPKLCSKIDYIYNLLDIANILKLSCKDIEFNDECFKIISIGRLDPVKQFEKIPYIINEIYKYDKKLKFKWFIIGDGDLKVKTDIDSEIKKYGLENILLCLGMKDNPYPYIKQSNILVSTSYSEACPYVINEAKILGVPVLVSNFDSAYELVNEENGIISSIDKMPSLLYKIIANYDGIYDRLLSSSKRLIYSNDEIINKINILFQK